ncbi:peptide-methionine (S)-S-oxide reductase MsrA [Pendulispora albinea]|uniref:Peptide methionine sulfoxide reductase MsrA n=1 Tax=Pendulispora albinea TaxID=2741071 RepID=A0ABZ2M6I9_9BACT
MAVGSGCRAGSVQPAPAQTTSATVAKTNVGANPGNVVTIARGAPLTPAKGHELAAFAEGCFWGSENTFRHVPGVVATAVGYTGGTTASPTYEDVSSHTTGHAETVLVEFDPSQVTYAKLLGVFFRSHDPTTKNRQGPDVGSQYRSAIFTFSAAQERDARAALADAQRTTKKPIVTQIAPMGAFWRAEDYHQQYDEKTGRESCPLPSVLGTQQTQ